MRMLLGYLRYYHVLYSSSLCFPFTCGDWGIESFRYLNMLSGCSRCDNLMENSFVQKSLPNYHTPEMVLEYGRGYVDIGTN